QQAQKRSSSCVNGPGLALRCYVTGVDFAIIPDRELTGEGIDITGPANFVKRIFETKPGLRSYQASDLLLALGQNFRRGKQNFLPVEFRQLGLEVVSSSECLSHLLRVCRSHGRDKLAAEGVKYLELVLPID